MNATLAFVLGLTLAGILPAIGIAGVSPAFIFLSPPVGAVTAGVAVELEIGLGGTLLLWFIVVAVILNAVAVGVLLQRPSMLVWQIRGLSLVTIVVLLVVLAIPLTGIRAHEVGYDGAITWTTHALLISGGHSTLVSGLQNPAYLPSNPDYPPLVPAVTALGYSFAGHTVLTLGSELTALLNAAAIGIVGVGIASVRRSATPRDNVLAIVVAAVFSLAAFSVGGNFIHVGNYGVDGDADLLWAAAAVLWGLVLPRRRSSLWIAWTCAIVASLTKNEGLVTAIAILLLTALRYGRPRVQLRGSNGESTFRICARSWGIFLALWIAPTIPGLVWLAQMHLLGVQNYFFGSARAESLYVRGSATARAMANSEDILLIAVLVVAIGAIWFRDSRRQAGLGHPLWLWTAWTVGNILVAATYVFGDLEIHTWLTESVDRTTIYGKLLILVEIAVWAVLAGSQLMDTYLCDLRPRSERGDTTQSPIPALVGSEK